MKRAVAWVLVAVLACGLGTAWGAADKIGWHSYEDGMARSKFEKKKVFLHFFADWCTYCVEMERVTFKDPAVVAALNRDFIPIRVDADREKTTSALYRVKGLPDSWFIAETGAVIGHRPGFIPAEQLLALFKLVLSGAAGK